MNTAKTALGTPSFARQVRNIRGNGGMLGKAKSTTSLRGAASQSVGNHYYPQHIMPERWKFLIGEGVGGLICNL